MRCSALPARRRSSSLLLVTESTMHRVGLVDEISVQLRMVGCIVVCASARRLRRGRRILLRFSRKMFRDLGIGFRTALVGSAVAPSLHKLVLRLLLLLHFHLSLTGHLGEKLQDVGPLRLILGVANEKGKSITGNVENDSLETLTLYFLTACRRSPKIQESGLLPRR